MIDLVMVYAVLVGVIGALLFGRIGGLCGVLIGGVVAILYEHFKYTRRGK